MKRLLLTALAAAAVILTFTAGQPSVADSGSGGSGSGHRHIEIRDDCDRTTFDQVLGPGACLTDGDTTFEELFESLVEGDPDGHWRNNPDETHVRRGEHLMLTNTGGEFHTFTEVRAFGPGCVPEINEPLGLEGPPAADCPAAFSDPQTALPSGGSGMVSTTDMRVGIHHFMCMIHPWMQTTVEVRRR